MVVSYLEDVIDEAVSALCDDGEIVAKFYESADTAIVWCIEDGWRLERHEFYAEQQCRVLLDRASGVCYDQWDDWITVWRDGDPVWRDDIGRI